MFSAVESTDVNECNEPEDVTEDVKENWDDSEEAVSYTHLTLPTKA